jgi:hypothetical protein
VTATLLILIATIATIELARRLNLLAHFAEMAAVSHRSMRLLPRTGVSEWAKERAMRLTALKLLGTSLRAGMLLAVAGAPLAVALLLTRDTAGDWLSRSLLLVGTLGYSMIRRRGTQWKTNRARQAKPVANIAAIHLD